MAALNGVTFLIWAVSSALVRAAESDPKCSYRVETVQFGLLMKITYFTPHNYTIDVAEKEGRFKRRSTVSFSNENSTHEIKPLKPCTEYELIVTLIPTNGTEITCKKTDNKTTITTTGMSEQDIKKASCPSGYLCYQSGWNISSLVSKHNKVSAAEFINGSYRFKPAYEDICTDFVLKFPDKNCNISLNSSEYVPVDFIDPNDINQTAPTELPAKIETKFPSNCKNLSVEYKCSGKDNNSVEPSDMKPFTDYSCTGHIKNNGVFINKTTPPVQFNINCDYATDEGRMMNLLDGGRCEIKNLKPYEDYICEVRPIYGDRRDFKGETFKEKTQPGNNYKLRFGLLIFYIIIIAAAHCVAFFIRRTSRM
ncbi:uncharacterized protein LOC124873892 [Girardinichthys multiradiatus]|uniref:uncharacterized protein LOC124873892 n=1 Tax=Girardinichthys multiradiatus TaxID=208333 RepID=UPI001FADA8A6|nr:uncharacterized protein LOC124873892 [Girardinichthys multiradiatus]